jgi:hypothetical protein
MSKLMLLLLLAVPAHADPPRAKAPPQEKAQPAVRYDFDDDVVEGGTLSPDGAIVDTLRPIKQSSLIKIREDFKAEMLKSAEDR